jgi:hypothetical protein
LTTSVPSSHTRHPSRRSKRCSTIFAWKKSNRESRGCRSLPPPPSPSMPHRSLRHPLPLLVGRNTHHSSTNSDLNNNSCSSPTTRRTTATMVAVIVVVAPPTPLPPMVCGPPTLTPGLALLKCARVLGWGGVGVQQPHLSP